MSDKKHSEKSHKEKTLKKEVEELKDNLQRVQAEFENSRKRLEKEKKDFSGIANARLISDLLPLLDSMDAARERIDDTREIRKEEVIEGMESIQKQFFTVLKSQGLEEIKTVGKALDPMKEDCVMQGKDKKKKDGIVLEELQKGYSLNGKVLRHAKVKVNKL